MCVYVYVNHCICNTKNLNFYSRISKFLSYMGWTALLCNLYYYSVSLLLLAEWNILPLHSFHKFVLCIFIYNDVFIYFSCSAILLWHIHVLAMSCYSVVIHSCTIHVLLLCRNTFMYWPCPAIMSWYIHVLFMSYCYHSDVMYSCQYCPCPASITLLWCSVILCNSVCNVTKGKCYTIVLQCC